MAKKSIVFFTVGYPYGQGDEFLDPEMKCAESVFERILIVSCDKKSSEIKQYVPRNASLLNIRDDVSSLRLLVIRLLLFFSPTVWRKIILFIKERGLHGLRESVSAVILQSCLIKLLRRKEDHWVGKYDFYYSYWLAGPAAYIALRKEALGGVLLSRAHGYDCFAYRGFHPFRQEQINNIDFIFPISDAGKEDLIAQGCDPSKIKVERLGVEKTDEKINPYKKTKTKRIVTCSNIVDLKRLDLLIAAFSLIDSVYIEWVHFGDGILREEIERLAKQKLSKKKNISYIFKGRVQLKKIFEYYALESIDCFVNCSDVEGIPVSIMEAMSYGIPCIARDVGGNSEIVINKMNGYLLPTNCNESDLSEAVIKLLSLPSEVYMKMRDEAQKKYNCAYNADNNYRLFWNNILENYPYG